MRKRILSLNIAGGPSEALRIAVPAAEGSTGPK